jgi:hypothetical protein
MTDGRGAPPAGGGSSGGDRNCLWRLVGVGGKLFVEYAQAFDAMGQSVWAETRPLAQDVDLRLPSPVASWIIQCLLRRLNVAIPPAPPVPPASPRWVDPRDFDTL